MRLEFYLVERYGVSHKAYDCNELAALAEAKGYGKLVEKLGKCGDGEGGALIELKYHDVRVDKLELKKDVGFERVCSGDKE